MHLLLIIILLLPFNSLPAQVGELTVDGRGSTYNSALSDAKRKAVEQGIGVIIASEQIVNNFQLISDKIYSKSEGYVKTFRELGTQRETDGTYVVKIEAEVTAILDEIVKDQLAVDLLLQWLHKPRFIFLIDENNLGDTTSIVAETEIGRLMEEKGFPVFSASQREQIKKRAQSINSAEGDLRAVEAIGNEFAAEYIVLGNAASSITDASDLLGKGWKSGKAYISARIIKTDTGEIIAQNTFDAAAPEINDNIAGVKAIKKASEDLADYLIRETISRWSAAQSNTRTVLLRINNITRSQRKLIEAFLQSGVEGFQSLSLRSFSLGSADYSLEVTCEPSDIADRLDGKDFGEFSLQVIEETGNSVTAKATGK